MVGVTVIVAVTGAVPVFVAGKDAISPKPLAPSPIVVLEFVQVNVPPAGLLVKFVEGATPLLQRFIFAGTLAVGKGCMVITAESLTAGQLPVAATVLVTV